MRDRRSIANRRAAGFTLLELMLALAGTALIGTAVAAMLHATAYAATSDTDQRDLIPAQRILAGRFADAIINARAVKHVTADTLVLWYDDLNGNGTCDTTELQWITYDAATGNLVSARGDPAQIALPVIDGVTNYAIIRWGFDLIDALDEEAWAEGLAGLSFAVDLPAPASRLVWVTVAVALGNQSETQLHAAAVGGGA